jgi:hypothetical protein
MWTRLRIIRRVAGSGDQMRSPAAGNAGFPLGDGVVAT